MWDKMRFSEVTAPGVKRGGGAKGSYGEMVHVGCDYQWLGKNVCKIITLMIRSLFIKSGGKRVFHIHPDHIVFLIEKKNHSGQLMTKENSR